MAGRCRSWDWLDMLTMTEQPNCSTDPALTGFFLVWCMAGLGKFAYIRRYIVEKQQHEKSPLLRCL